MTEKRAPGPLERVELAPELVEVVTSARRGPVRLLLDDRDGVGRVTMWHDAMVWSNVWWRTYRAGPADLETWFRRLNLDYAAGKMGASRHYDAAKTETAAKAAIVRARRLDRLDAEMARELFDAIGDHVGLEGGAQVWFARYVDEVPDGWDDDVIQNEEVHPIFAEAFAALVTSDRQPESNDGTAGERSP